MNYVAPETITANKHLRGRRIISADEAFIEANRQRREEDYGLVWGGVVLPSETATSHFCVVGATGSGKTMILRLLMQSCLPLIGQKHKNKPRVELYEEDDIKLYKKEIKEYEKIKKIALSEIEEKRQSIAFLKQCVDEENEKIKYFNSEIQRKIEKHKSFNSRMSFIFGFIFTILLFATPELSDHHVILKDSKIYNGLYGACIISLIISITAYSEWKQDISNKPQYELKKENIWDGSLENAIEPFNVPEPTMKKVVKSRLIEDSEKGDGHRALIYDAKGDIISLLHGMGLSSRIVILNPFDTRSAAWDMASDIDSPAAARQLATILIPEDKNASQPFFASAARDLLTNVIMVFIKLKPGEWTFRDVILAMKSKDRLINLLKKTPETEDLVSAFFEDKRTSDNIMSEIKTRIAPFETVASVWNYSKDKISLRHWVKNEYILVLGSNEEHRATLDPINRVIFQRITELILSQSNSKTRKTWIFLDEIREAGNLESLGRLMTNGRSKGACVVLGFQDIEGMRDAFGKERANELVGQAANKIILNINSPETAKWASELFGSYEFIEEETSENTGSSVTSGETTTEGTSTGETVTYGTSEGITKGITTGLTEGITTGVTDGITTGITNGTTTGITEGQTTGDTSGHSRGQTYQNFFGTLSNQQSWQQSNQRSKQTSSQDSRQKSTQNSKQSSKQNSKQTSTQNSEQSSTQKSESNAQQNSTNQSTAKSASETDNWSTTINRKRMEKSAILSSQFAQPVTNPKNGLHGYYLIPSLGAFHGILTGKSLSELLIPADETQPDYIERPSDEQYLRMWTKDELASMGMITEQSGSADTATSDQKTDEQPKRQIKTNLRWLPDTDAENGLTRI